MVNLAGATFYPHCDCLKMICRHASLIGMGQPHLELVATAGLDICLLLLQHSLCQKMCMSLKPIDRPTSVAATQLRPLNTKYLLH